MMAFMAFSTSFAKASSDVYAVAVEVIAWDFGSQNEFKHGICAWQPITGGLGR